MRGVERGEAGDRFGELPGAQDGVQRQFEGVLAQPPHRGGDARAHEFGRVPAEPLVQCRADGGVFPRRGGDRAHGFVQPPGARGAGADRNGQAGDVHRQRESRGPHAVGVAGVGGGGVAGLGRGQPVPPAAVGDPGEDPPGRGLFGEVEDHAAEPAVPVGAGDVGVAGQRGGERGAVRAAGVLGGPQRDVQPPSGQPDGAARPGGVADDPRGAHGGAAAGPGRVRRGPGRARGQFPGERGDRRNRLLRLPRREDRPGQCEHRPGLGHREQSSEHRTSTCRPFIPAFPGGRRSNPAPPDRATALALPSASTFSVGA